MNVSRDRFLHKTYVVGNRMVNSKLLGEPLGERLEATAQNGQLVPQSLQCAAKLTGTIGDGEDGLEFVEDVGRDALEEADALL